jgi:hypothetical protein
MNEAMLLASVTARLAAAALAWHHCREPRRSCEGRRGLPDLIIAGPGGAECWELKSDTGDTSADQDLWLAWLARAGWTVRLVTPADLRSGAVDAAITRLASPPPALLSSSAHRRSSGTPAAPAT